MYGVATGRETVAQDGERVPRLGRGIVVVVGGIGGVHAPHASE